MIIQLLLTLTILATPPELPAEVYAARRAKLMKQLDNCVGVLKSYGDAENPDHDFFYLTGIRERDAVLVLAPREKINKTVLLLAPRDEEYEQWTGFREPMSYDLREKYKVDWAGRSRRAAPRGFGPALRKTRCYAYLRPAFAKKPGVDSKILGEYLKAYEAKTVQRWQALRDMRMIKDSAEIAMIDKAIAATKAGHVAAIAAIKPGAVEKQVQGAIEAGFYDAGATGVGFESIVGSGANAAVLHWIRNDRAMHRDDLVLVDIGAEFGGYTADITRTYPVAGKFTQEQLAVYDKVLEVQQKVINAVRPGVRLEELNQTAERLLHEAGYDFPHGVGHYVGLQVHDVGDRTMPLKPGMVITVEPGIYIKDKVGVRIEDMVLVTRTGHTLMTDSLPRKPAEIESWMKRVRKASATP